MHKLSGSHITGVLPALCPPVLLCCLCACASSQTNPVKLGRFTARFASGGIHVTLDSVPLLKGGVVQVFYSDPEQEDFGSAVNPPPAVAAALPGGGVQYTAQLQNGGKVGEFRAEQTIEAHPDGTVRFTLHGHWSGQKPARLEWNPIRIWAYPLVGARFDAVTPSGRADGRIGRTPPAPDYPGSRICPECASISISAPGYAAIEISTPDMPGLTVFDAREDRYLASQKVLWAGNADYEMEPGKSFVRTIEMRVTPEHPAPAGPPGAAHVESVAGPLRALPAPSADERQPIVTPAPKQIRYTKERFSAAGKLSFYLDDAAFHSPPVEACNELLGRIARQGFPRGAVLEDSSGGAPGIHIAIAGAGLRPEGYRLSVQNAHVSIEGADARGAYYGVQTLGQLFVAGQKHTGWFAGVEVEDWPSLSFRGAHLFVGRDARPLHIRLIDTILSRCKMNALVIECEYVRWPSHPELWLPESMDPADLRLVAEDARLHFVDSIPLINTLGHSEWMFKNGAHTDLAEDVSSPHNYDASNPQTYRLVFDVFSDALDAFNHPKLFHIGHDEVKTPSYDTRGRYPARPANIAKGAVSIFIEDTNRLADWLRAHGARSMLWGDMLLNRAEGAAPGAGGEMAAANAPSVADAERLRAQTPRDAVICDWRYEPGQEQRNGLRLFIGSGHSAIGCAWFQPDNIKGWAEQAEAAGALGTLQTTWAGYDLNEGILETEFRQFAAYIDAAEQAWNGGSSSFGARSYDSGDLFRALYNDAGIDASGRACWYADLSRAANINLFGRDDEGPLWSAYPSAIKEPSADTVYRMLRLTGRCRPGNLPLLGEHPGGIMLAGEASPAMLPVGFGRDASVAYPDGARIDIGRKASALDFVQACGYAVDDGTPTAAYRVVYTSGESEGVNVRYGYEIRSLDDMAQTGLSTDSVALRGAGGARIALRRFHWTNPHPEKEIASIEFRSLHPYAAPALFALVGYR